MGYYSLSEVGQDFDRLRCEFPHLIVKAIKSMFNRPASGVAMSNLFDIDSVFINIGYISMNNINTFNWVPLSICNSNIHGFILSKYVFR